MQHISTNPLIKKNAAGLTMIEVLITLSIVSVGLLGMAALQLTGVRSVSSSSLRTEATLLADDIIERMRANPVAMDNNDFMSISTASIDCSTLPTKYCSEHYSTAGGMVAAQSCTPDELAAYDINVWYCGVNADGERKNGVLEHLPATDDGTPTATITCTDTDPSGGDSDPCSHNSPHQVTISWSEINPSNEGAATITQSISLTVQP
jgi:type IV pilus assembly protein PilV